MFFINKPSSTIRDPPLFFHVFATSSSTFSAVPSSRHAEPQCLPTKVASDCNAGDVNVRLCFFVRVRKASGLSDGGGNKMGRMVEIAGLNAGGGIGRSRGLIGCAGVPNAGLEDGTRFSCRRSAAAMIKFMCVLNESTEIWYRQCIQV